MDARTGGLEVGVGRERWMSGGGVSWVEVRWERDVTFYWFARGGGEGYGTSVEIHVGFCDLREGGFCMGGYGLL